MPVVSKKTRPALAAALTTLLVVVATLAVAYAAPAAQAGASGHFGVISEIGVDEFTIQTQAGLEVFALTSATQVHVGNIPARLDILREGQRVAVRARSEGGRRVAVQVMAIPAEPQSTHLTVTVLERTSEAIVARDQRGNEVRLDVRANIPSDSDGKVVTIVTDRAPRESGAQVAARAAVSTDDLILRLRHQIEEARRSGNTDLAVALEARLKDVMEQSLTRLASTAQQLPEQARDRVQTSIERQVDSFDRTLREIGAVSGMEPNAVEVQGLSGVLHEMNTRDGYMVIQQNDGMVVRLLINTETRVELNGQAARLMDLQSGDSVGLRYNVRTRMALYIAATTRDVTLKGMVRSVDVAGGVVAVTFRTGDLRLRVNGGTRITVNGVPASLADLQPGILALISYDSRSMEAQSIEADATVNATGLLLRVDAANGFIAVDLGDGTPLTLTVTRHTHIEVNGVIASLARLGGGAGGRVALVYDARTREVLKLSARVQAEPPAQPAVRVGIGGEIAGFGDRTVIIRGDDRSTVELGVTVDTLITIGDRPGVFGDLREGLLVRAVYDRASQDAYSLQVAARLTPGEQPQRRAQLSGRIALSDGSSMTLSVITEEGRTVDLLLSRATKVELAGRPTTFADLVRGAVVAVVYEHPSMTALTVTIRSSAETDPSVRPLPALADVHIAVRKMQGSFVQYVDGRFVLRSSRDDGDLTFAVDRGVRVSIDGSPSSIDRLERGTPIAVEINSVGAIIAVHANPAGDSASASRPAETKRLEGTLGEVSAERQYLILRMRTGAETLRFSPNVRVTMDGVGSAVGRLQVGHHAIVEVGPDGLVSTVLAFSPSVRPEGAVILPGQAARGSISGVLPGRSSLSLRTSSGVADLAVTARTRITIDGAAGSLERLAVGMNAVVELGSDGTAISVAATSTQAQPTDPTRPAPVTETKQIGGSLGEVVPDRRIIVVRTATGSVNVTVTSSTRIVVNGVAGVLTALQPGMTVSVTMTADGNATIIEARGGLTTDTEVVRR